MSSLEFFIDLIILAAKWPWDRLRLQQKWMPGIFPGGRSDRCSGLTIMPPSCGECLKILGISNCYIHKGLSRPVQGQFQSVPRAPREELALRTVKISRLPTQYGTCCGAVGWGTALHVAKSLVRFPDGLLKFFIDLINFSGR
jgi:hypothetical protein